MASNLEPSIMSSKHQTPVSRGDVSVTDPAPNFSEHGKAKQGEAIAHALAPLRSAISNPPTAADVKAVSDKLDALLAASRQ